MNIRETFTFFNSVPHISPLGPGNTATAAGAAVDRRGYDSLQFMVHVLQVSAVTSALSQYIGTGAAALAANSAPGASYWFVRMQHQDGSAAGLDAAAAWTDCGSIDVIREWSGAMFSGATAAGIVLYVDASVMSTTIRPLGYRGNKRFVRCLLSMVNMTMGASNVISLTSHLGHAENWPITTPNLD